MGTSIQIPARAPGLPANLWIHYAFNQTDWSDFPSNGKSRSDWSRTTVMGGVGVEPGDIPVASLCCLGIAGIQRETQGIFDTDDWGVAFDTFAPSAPASLQFVGEMATSGKCWPGGIWVAADVLVLRPSLIPAVPVPYGTYPAPSSRLKWGFEAYIALVRKFPHLTGDERKQLRQMNIELEELLDADDHQSLAELREADSQARKIIAADHTHGKPCRPDRVSHRNTAIRQGAATEGGREKGTCARAETAAASIVNIHESPAAEQHRCDRRRPGQRGSRPPIAAECKGPSPRHLTSSPIGRFAPQRAPGGNGPKSDRAPLGTSPRPC